MDILLKEEGVVVDKLLGHGGFFKTKGVGQKVMAAAVNAPVSVMETAGEGGAWGIALLAAYRKNKTEGESLASYLEEQVFAKEESVQIARIRKMWKDLKLLWTDIKRDWRLSVQQ